MGVQWQGDRAVPRLELGEALREFVGQQDEFIGTRVLPIFSTVKKQANFPAITRESITRDAETKRAPRSGYNRDGFEAKDKTFNCEEFGLEGILDDSERALYATDFDAELTSVQITMRRVMQAQEKRIADMIFNTVTWSGAALFTDNSAAPWDTPASDVLGQIRTAKQKVKQNCGLLPNAVIFNDINLDRLKSNTGVLEAIKYTARTTDQELMNALADLFGIPLVIVAKGIRNSAKEGKPFVSADIWSDDFAMLAVIASDAQRLVQPAVGRTFLWVEDSPENAVVESYREEPLRSDIFRVRHHVDELVIDPFFAHLMKVD